MAFPREDPGSGLAWLVCFCGSPWPPFQRLFGGRDNLAHVFAMRYDELTSRWTLLEYTMLGINSHPVPDDVAEWLIDHCLDNGAVLRFVSERAVWWFPPLVVSCVSVLKSALRIKAPLVWTPRALYHELVRRGADVIQPAVDRRRSADVLTRSAGPGARA